MNKAESQNEVNQSSLAVVGGEKQKPQRSALVALAHRIGVDEDKMLGTLKETVFKGASVHELMALVVVANQYGLNPFLKEIHAFPDKHGGIVPVVGIDGWLRIINEHPQFNGMEVEIKMDAAGKLPVSATCIIHRKDREHPTIITEYFSECRRDTVPWRTMPMRLMRHKAIIQGGRVAFGFAGIYDEDEARDAVTASAREFTTANPYQKTIPETSSMGKMITVDVDPTDTEKEGEALKDGETREQSGPTLNPGEAGELIADDEDEIPMEDILTLDCGHVIDRPADWRGESMLCPEHAEKFAVVKYTGPDPSESETHRMNREAEAEAKGGEVQPELIAERPETTHTRFRRFLRGESFSFVELVSALVASGQIAKRLNMTEIDQSLLISILNSPGAVRELVAAWKQTKTAE